ncbi:MAG: HD domain-containing protein [Desulfovibrio sp.]|jgi:HD-GYP domain-containing protein (c-di-GMP phosphodiesterase class II)|nr:HD domain-containing protein [Desulfovibrio sp.]
MTIRVDQLIRAIGTALDIIESGMFGVRTNHGKRVAVLCAAMGRTLGMNESAVAALSTCALFHDSALTEYMLYLTEQDGKAGLFLHCIYGQRNVDLLPLPGDTDGVVLYHHERADGTGAFGRREGNFPVGAALIAAADTLDLNFPLQSVSGKYLEKLRAHIASEAGKAFTRDAVEAALNVLDEDMLEQLRDEHIRETSEKLIPPWFAGMEDTAAFRLAALAARIIDYKSTFTRQHSMQIANRAWLMAGYCNYTPEGRAQLYLAAALHDLGKLATPLHILEKPGALTTEEFDIIKDHARGTHELLSTVGGMDDICRWASEHHEKLDGKGYPFGRGADDLDYNSRLLCCLDIYQGVCESRPYHPSRGHRETMEILLGMADKGLVDADIARDLDQCMGSWSERCLPPPPQAAEAVDAVLGGLPHPLPDQRAR